MKQVWILVENQYEDLELWYPKLRLQEEGHQVLTLGPRGGEIYTGKHGYPCVSDLGLDAIDSKGGACGALVVPGGFAPDKLRRLSKVIELVQSLDKQKKPVAFICHGGWVPISAHILKGRKATSFIAIRDDMENAGAIWSDEPLVIDQNLISSRKPADLPLFAKAIAKML